MRIGHVALLAVASCGRAAVPHVSVATPTPTVVAVVHAPVAAPPKPAACSYDVRNASTRYDFRVTTDAPCSTSDVATCVPGALAIRDKAGNAVARIVLDSVCLVQSGPGALLVDSSELYDSQGTILSGDFDFDGREDFAVQVGEDGPYGGPTFDVYVAHGDQFARSEALSQLTRETLGFFQVDAAHKHLVTFAKSGCCWHVTETLAVQNGTPKPIARHTVDATDPTVVVETDEHLAGPRWLRTTTRHAP